MIRKPAYGTPCNNCGDCCRESLCPLGTRLFNQASGPCPALEADGERGVCGLVAHPARYAPVRAAICGPARLIEAALLLIGAGHGCDAQLQNEPRAPKAYYRTLRQAAIYARPRVPAALSAWGVS